jgi:LemA protein
VSVLVTLVLVLIVVVAAGWLYDRLVKLRRLVQRTWQQLERERRNRQEIIGRVAAACAGSAMDAAAVEAVVTARKNAALAGGPAEAAQKEYVLGDAVGRLLTSSAIAIDAAIGALARELGEAEQNYRSARQVYNDAATRYNSALTTRPGTWIRGFGTFRRAEMFERPIADQ